MSIDIDESMKKVEEYISQVDMLLKMPYAEGIDRKEELNARIQNFIRTTFPDGEKKLKDYRSFVRLVHVGFESEELKQEDYIAILKKMRNYLVAYKEELQLRITSRKKSSKLDEIRKETKMAKAEAGRRAAVAEEKRWGAVIELLDMQRDELKRRDKLTQEIIELRKEIRDIKLMIAEPSRTSVRGLEENELKNRVREELEILREEITSDLENGASQKHVYAHPAFLTLEQDLIRKLDARTFRLIKQTYSKIDRLRLPSKSPTTDKKEYKETVDAINKTLETLR